MRQRLSEKNDVTMKELQTFLAPALREGDILVMDNLAAHKTPGVREAVTAQGRIGSLPPALLARSQPHRDGLTANRNDRHNTTPVTRFLPRIFAELAAGKSNAHDALMGMTAPDRVSALTATAGLTDEERTLVRVVLETAEAVSDLEQGTRAAIQTLKDDLAEDTLSTSVAEAFESRAK